MVQDHVWFPGTMGKKVEKGRHLLLWNGILNTLPLLLVQGQVRCIAILVAKMGWCSTLWSGIPDALP